MNTEQILHTCSISWGMTFGDADGWIEKMIEDKKQEVKEALQRAGYFVKSQHFIEDVEWGTLYTWADLVDDRAWISVGGKELKFGKFYQKKENPLDFSDKALKT